MGRRASTSKSHSYGSEHDSGSGSEEEEVVEDAATQQARMLEALNRQCMQFTGWVPSPAAVNAEESEEEEEEDSDEEEAATPAQEDDEWSGFNTGSATNLASTATGTVQVFNDPSTSRRKVEDFSLAPKDNFMSSTVRKADAWTPSTYNRKGKRKAALTEEEEAEEREMQNLDSNLLSLIKDLPSSDAKSADLLPQLASLPNPRLLTRKQTPKAIDPRAPRLLKEAIYTSRLGRARTQHAEALESGTILAKHNRNAAERDVGDLAITKKQRREETGREDARRKNAKGLGGVMGKMRKGGAVLTFNKEEVRKGKEGDFEGIQRRARKGAPGGGGKSFGGKSGGGGKGKRR